MKTRNIITKITIVSASLLVIGVAGSALVSAASDNTVISASIDSTIGVSSGHTVNLSITPGSGGTISSGSDLVKVTTSDSSGYTLTFADTDSDTFLAHSTDHITAMSGTESSPASLTTNNTWGYRVDDASLGFGAGPTTGESNASTSAFTWAGVPKSTLADTIKTTAAPATNDPTTFWYAVRADQTIPSGSYTDTVTYTATAN